MTMCDAERRLLANALLDISNEWFVLVSESCIPIFDFNTCSPVRFSYNPSFSACFFSRNSVFLSQQISRNSVSVCFFSEANGVNVPILPELEPKLCHGY